MFDKTSSDMPLEALQPLRLVYHDGKKGVVLCIIREYVAGINQNKLIFVMHYSLAVDVAWLIKMMNLIIIFIYLFIYFIFL